MHLTKTLNQICQRLAKRIAYSAAILAILTVGPLTMAADAKRPTLVIIGATAATGEYLIPLALERGYQVVGLARNPAAVTLKHENLSILKGDVYDRQSIEAALTGTETVIGLFGPRVDITQSIPKMDLFSTGYSNVIAAMTSKGNKRLLATSSIGAQKIFTTEPGPDAPRAEQWLWQIRGTYIDMQLMESIVSDSELDYTILRPGQLMRESPRNDLKIAIDEDAPELRLITYPDFGRFILDVATDGSYIGNTVGLYSDRQLQYGVNFSTDD